jgi:hypothetical protein
MNKRERLDDLMALPDLTDGCRCCSLQWSTTRDEEIWIRTGEVIIIINSKGRYYWMQDRALAEEIREHVTI